MTEISGRRPREVSGGEQQRCSIARALIGEPKLLLLDEPARGLDASLRATLYATLRQVRADFNTPILLVTHDLEECFELGDEMLVLREGSIAQSGAPKDVLAQPANVEVARLLGVRNLFQAEIAALDPGPQHQPAQDGGLRADRPLLSRPFSARPCLAVHFRRGAARVARRTDRIACRSS